MECFVAAVRLHADQQGASLDVAQLQCAVQPLATDESQLWSWANTHVAIAGCTRRWASDMARRHASDQVIVVDGPVVDVRATAAQQDATQHEWYHDRLKAVSTAAQRWIMRHDGFDALSGSFCSLFHNAADDRTLLVMDRLGSRPIFVYQTIDYLYCASDIRALLNLPFVERELDLEAVVQLIRFQMILGSKTLYRNIRLLAPATVLTVDHRSGSVQETRYWRLQSLDPFATEAEAIDATAHAFCTATNRIVADSEHLGLFLSGGFDSRMLLASLDQAAQRTVRAHTFGPSFTDEASVARTVAETCNVSWQFIAQPLHAYWSTVGAGALSSNGLNAAGHMHLYQPTTEIAAHGYDTVLNGWGFDLPYSGSYFPKESFTLLGRQLYTYRLQRLHDQASVLEYLHRSLDTQNNDFNNSLLDPSLKARWHAAPRTDLEAQVAYATTTGTTPYDWIDHTLFGCGISKFRSYSMLMNIRAQVRERNPLFENELIEVYQRLPYRWRFLGPVFRRAVRKLNPALAALPYSNIGTSAFAPPLVQALSLQGRTAYRANLRRVRSVGQQLGFMQRHGEAGDPYGSYHHAHHMALYLRGQNKAAEQMQRLLVNGPLVEAGLLDPRQLTPAFERCAAGSSKTGFTLMAWTSLALWLDAYPATLPITAAC